ncbi:MAG: nickel-dependent hydrogenase large subunit [bacterium]
MSASSLPLNIYLPAVGNPLKIEYEIQSGRVSRVQVSLGYSHRGIEKLAGEQNLWQNLVLLQRICGICTASHTTCFCQALEKLGRISIPQRAASIRTLVAEIERIQSHLFPLIFIADHLDLSSCLSSLFEARENAAAMLNLVTGKRVNYDFNQVGGVRINLKDSHLIKTLLSRLDAVDQSREEMDRCLITHSRLRGIGILSTQDAQSTLATGPVARASGISQDIRKNDGYAFYPHLDFQIPVKNTGDVLARCEVRVLEIGESIRMIRQLLTSLHSLPESPVSIDPSFPLPAGSVAASVEAPRGENFYRIVLSDHLHLEQIHITTPTDRNLDALKIVLTDSYVEDVPLIVASIDPCYACLER